MPLKHHMNSQMSSTTVIVLFVKKFTPAKTHYWITWNLCIGRPWSVAFVVMFSAVIQKLLRHHLTHFDDRPFSCKFCPMTFKRLDTLKYHEDNVRRDVCGDGNDVFIARQCRSCLKSYIRNHHLVECMGLGKPRREHQCLICLKSYHCCFRINGHHDTHNLDEIPRSKAFQCDRCFRLLASIKSLSQHKCETVPKNKEHVISDPCGYPTVSYLWLTMVTFTLGKHAHCKYFVAVKRFGAMIIFKDLRTSSLFLIVE